MAGECILVVDDDPEILQLVSLCLESEGMEVFTSLSVREATAALAEREFDLVLLDLNLKDLEGDGYKVLKAIRERDLNVPVLIVSAKKETYNKVIGLGLGADDYITKPFYPEELIARIKAHMRRASRSRGGDGTTLRCGRLLLDFKEMKLFKDDEMVELSARSFKLLRFLMENPGQVFSKKQIYQQVWEDGYYDANSVMVYINRLRKKIEDDPDNPKYVKTVWGLGYKLECQISDKT